MAQEPTPPEGGPPPGEGGSGGMPVAGAGLGRRFLARLLDGILVGVAISILAPVLGLPPPTMGLGGLDAWTTAAVTSGIWLAYYVATEAQLGTTLGKRLLGLHVVGPDGGHPSVTAATIRNVWLLFGLVPLVGGLVQLVAVIIIAVTIATSDTHRGKHDEFAGTAVIR
ncbi:RDD family protein [Egibacter rhizosphaerae]|uniref:RDD family protein n=1 Tax=Egibacter rhizosphaerae TaxID=1670831 RepID=A0A411YFV4_9ACTN|nr:RDD family protein [Egibacter rhizosphaerae]QBI20110.1 RDD family protein [Egibacter rhizosphaerae]